MSISFEVTRNPKPVSDADRETIIANPTFGTHFTDHQVVVVWEKDKGWHSAEVIPYGPMLMDPSSAVLHYGQEIFEGIKAYRHDDGSIWTFRPKMNAARLQRSTSIFPILLVIKAWTNKPFLRLRLIIRPEVFELKPRFKLFLQLFLVLLGCSRAALRVRLNLISHLKI